MTLLFDLGNTHLHVALATRSEIIFRFMIEGPSLLSVNQIRQRLRKSMTPDQINVVANIASASVDPRGFEKLRLACRELFYRDIFVIAPENVFDIDVKYEVPTSLGRDRLAASVAAANLYRRENIIIFDLGTATTVSVVSRRREFLGGWITPGLVTQAASLRQKTALLPNVKVVSDRSLGQNTERAISAGLYLQGLFFMRGAVEQIRREIFFSEPVVVIGTGGMSALYEDSDVFDCRIPELVLLGVWSAFQTYQKIERGETDEKNIDENENPSSDRHRSGSELRGLHFDRSQAV